MKRVAVTATLVSTTLALLLAPAAAQATIEGGWNASRQKGEPGTIQMNVSYEHSNHGEGMRIADFDGLSAAQVASAAATPVSFSLQREAGTIRFEGTFRNGSGGGGFEFTANPAYLDALRGMGVAVSGGRHGGGSADERLLSLAMLDVSTDFIRSMKAIGYDESLDDYIAMRIFHVDPDLVADFQKLGMRPSADQLVASQIHGATPEFIGRMRDLGLGNLHLDDYVAFRIHGVSPDFVKELADLGYRDLDGDDLVAFRIHGVSPEFVRQLAELGYRDLSADDLVAFRIHGVSADFIKDLAELGYRDVRSDDLIAFRIHGVTPKFIRDLQADGYDDLSADDLVSMKIHGRGRQ